MRPFQGRRQSPRPGQCRRRRRCTARRQLRQNFLRQHHCRNRADMAAGLAAFDHQRIRARAQQLLRQRQRRRRRRPAVRAECLDRLDRRTGGMPPASTTWLTPCPRRPRSDRTAAGCMVIRLTPNGLVGQRLGRGDFGAEQVRRHRPAGDHAEPARIADRGDKVALGHPGHRAAQDRVFAAKKRPRRAASWRRFWGTGSLLSLGREVRPVRYANVGMGGQAPPRPLP